MITTMQKPSTWSHSKFFGNKLLNTFCMYVCMHMVSEVKKKKIKANMCNNSMAIRSSERVLLKKTLCYVHCTIV